MEASARLKSVISPSEYTGWSTTKAGYHIRVSQELEDPDWDAFVAKTPGGDHVQTSLWAQVKTAVNWKAARIVVGQGGAVVAGAQLLLRPVPLIGAIGYVPKGPLVARDDPALQALVIDQLHQVARRLHVPYLAVQPPYQGEALAQQLQGARFRPSSFTFAPSATTIVDLAPEPEAILARMKPKTRYNLRLGQRQGIAVREGNERDLGTFYRLLVATAHRQQFTPESEDYVSKLWRILRPHGYIRLFLAEHAGEALSAFLVIPFGDTVLYKRGGWAGVPGAHRPNELLHWTVMEWARSQGYRYYDFEGISLDAAQAITAGETLPDNLAQSVTRFKLGFGGQVILSPGTYERIYNRLLGWAYYTFFSDIASKPVMTKVKNVVRGSAHG